MAIEITYPPALYPSAEVMQESCELVPGMVTGPANLRIGYDYPMTRDGETSLPGHIFDSEGRVDHGRIFAYSVINLTHMDFEKYIALAKQAGRLELSPEAQSALKECLSQQYALRSKYFYKSMQQFDCWLEKNSEQDLRSQLEQKNMIDAATREAILSIYRDAMPQMRHTVQFFVDYIVQHENHLPRRDGYQPLGK
jgi:hypothetical protein